MSVFKGIVHRLIGAVVFLMLFAPEMFAQTAEDELKRADNLVMSSYEYSLMYRDYIKSSEYLEQALEIYREYDSVGSKYFNALYSLAESYEKAEDFIKASEVYESYWKAAGTDGPRIMNAASKVASIHYGQKNYGKAKEWFKKCIELSHGSDVTYNSYVSDAYANLAQIYSLENKSASALNTYLELRDYLVRNFKTNTARYSSTLLELGRIYSRRGNYELAYNYFKEAATYGFSAHQQAVVQSGIGMFHCKMGDFETAAKHVKESLCLLEENLGKTHPDYAVSLGNLGCIYMEMEEYEKALDYLLESVELLEYAPEEYLPDCMASYGNVGMVLEKVGMFEEALEVYKYLIVKMEDAYGKDKLDYAHMLNNIGIVYSSLGNYDESIEFISESIELEKKIAGGKTLDYAMAVNNLCFSLWAKNRTSSKALSYLSEILELHYSGINEVFAFLTEKEREHYWDNWGFMIDNLKALSHSHEDYNTSAKLLYDACLLDKGLLLNTTLEMETLITESGNESMLADWSRLKSIKKTLSDWAAEPMDEHPENLSFMESEADVLERKLMNDVKGYGDYLRYLGIRWEDVRNALGKDELSVEFVFSEADGRECYCAVLLRSGWKSPKKVLLNFNGLSPSDSDGTPRLGIYDDAEVGARVWKEILKYANPGDKIFFSPDGVLHQIGAEYLMIDGGERVNELYRMFRLSSTRNIAHVTLSPVDCTAALYGGLNYNTDVESMEFYASEFKDSTRGIGRFDFIGNESTLPWGYLKGTRREVENIEPLLQGHNYKTSLYMDDEGVEETFKSLSGKRTGIIHVATHGFYIKPKQRDRKETEDMVLKNTGLILSGANNAWLGRMRLPENVEDGILTSYEISKLDLRGADLVVMSACQTGLGEVSGDGVYGLQRAFKKAGAQTLIMSMWNVSDEATQLMMSDFYKGLSCGLSKREAFFAAQEKVKQASFVVNGHVRRGSEPCFWASFVLLD